MASQTCKAWPALSTSMQELASECTMHEGTRGPYIKTTSHEK
jgi:hypothetical protein